MKLIPLPCNTITVQGIKDGSTMMRIPLKKGSTALEWLWLGFTPDFVMSEGNEGVRPYSVGDILWVKETFYGYDWKDDGNGRVYESGYVYRMDSKDGRPFDVSDEWCIHEYGNENKKMWPKWKPSIHMPLSACRFFLKITNVRAERLQDISEEDAIREGICPVKSISNRQLYKNYLPDGYTEVLPIDSYQSKWTLTHGKESWELNPWVFVITYERTERPQNNLNPTP